ncbi:MAG: hypothetical protein JWP12_2136 [Bacteroidetes bacterium]|nr:hypothetical protein [Bacteroidota bacterium]
MKLKLRFFRIILVIILSGFIFGTIHFYYNAIYIPKQLYSQALIAEPVDVIIIPGVPYDGGKWGFIMRWRVYWSVYLYKTGRAKNIIYSGSAVYTPYTEATIMALYAEKMGVPKAHIFTETKAQHTTENLYYSWQIAQKQGFKTVAFATDPFQSYKIAPYIPKFNLNVTLIPMVIPIMEQLKMQDYEIESAKAYQLHFVSIRERETPEQQEFYSKGGRIKTN